MFYKQLKSADPQVYDAIKKELQKQREHLELIPSENRVSLAVMETLANPMQNNYAEGYPGKRYYGGCEFVDIVERLAIIRVCRRIWLPTWRLPRSATQLWVSPWRTAGICPTVTR